MLGEKMEQRQTTKMLMKQVCEKQASEQRPIAEPQAGSQRETFPGGMKVDTGPPNLIGPPKP